MGELAVAMTGMELGTCSIKELTGEAGEEL